MNIAYVQLTYSWFYHHSKEPQNLLLEFLKSIAHDYRSDQQAKDFIPDLLQLKVPLLFVAENEPRAGDVGDTFSSFLHEYIRRNNLRPVITNKIKDTLSCVTDNEQYAFHGIVLNVLHSVSIFNVSIFNVCMCVKTVCFRLSFMCQYFLVISDHISWFQDDFILNSATSSWLLSIFLIL